VQPGGRISIDARFEEDGMLALSVVDNGKGVEPKDLQLIFEAYFSKREGGTGLGLALVRRIVDEHGGHVHAENNPGGGLRLELRLPTEA